MAGPNLQINIGANLAQAVAGLNQTGAAANTAAAGLNNTGTAATNASRGLNSLAPAIRPNLQGLTLLGSAAQGAGRGLAVVPPAVNATTAAISRVRPAASQATFAITNFGRGLQDVPFGTIGFANNIEGVVTGFVGVFRSAGGAAAGFRAIGASLLGPGGLILGISVLSTVLTLVGQGVINFGGESDNLKKSLEEANDAAGEQIASLRVLNVVATDNTRSTQERTLAATQLQKELKESNVQISQEAILNGQATIAIRQATAAIIERAKARAIEERIAKLTTENLNRELQRPELLKRRLDTQKRLNEELAKETRIAGAPSTVAPEVQGLATAARNELFELDQATLDTSKQINDLLQLIDTADLTPKFDDGKITKSTDLLKQRIDALKTLRDETGLATAQQRELVSLEVQLLRRDGVKLGFTPEEIEDRVQQLIATTRFGREAGAIEVTIPLLARLSPQIDVAGGVLKDGQISPDAFNGVITQIGDSADIANQKLQERLAESLRNTITNGFIDGLSGIGESVGNVISGIFSGDIGNVLAAAGQSLLNIIGGVLQEVGKQVILASTLVKLLREKLATLFANPAGGIAVGIALVALGQVLKNIKFNVPGFADGVTSFAGGLAMVGERGPELVRLPAGSDVIPNNRLGGFSSNVFIATSVLRGEDIYTSYNRTGGRLSRI